MSDYRNGHMILPNCYVQNLRLVNLNFHATKGGNLHVLLERFKMTEDHNLSHLHDCVKVKNILNPASDQVGDRGFSVGFLFSEIISWL